MRHALRVVGEPTGAGPDLAVVLSAVAEGDLHAFGVVYDALAPLVHGVCLRVVRDPARAEEVTQEVLVEVWQQAARYDARRGSVRTWVLTVAHRRAVDAVRSSQAARERDDAVGRLDPVSVGGPEEQVVAADERVGVRRCLESLTPLQSQAVRLAYYQGYTYREVAAHLDRPLSTVKTRMRDGLVRLRDCLEGGADDES